MTKKFLATGVMHSADEQSLSAAGVGMIGYDFRPESPRLVRMISSNAGIIPDYSRERLRNGGFTPKAPEDAVRVGEFADDMPQTIVTRVYNYNLGAVLLRGGELPVMIENLRRTLVPDIVPYICVIKALAISGAADFAKADAYEGVADMLLFDFGGSAVAWPLLLGSYAGHTPFIIGNVYPNDAEALRSVCHPQFAGIELGERFESEIGQKDLQVLGDFIAQL